MKKKLIGFLLILTIMAGVPLFTVKNNCSGEISGAMNQDKNENVLTGLLAAKFRKEYTDEALAALAVLLNSNYNSAKEKYNLDKPETYISKKVFLKKCGDSYYSKIENTAKKYKNTLIKRKGKAVMVPIFYTSAGYTEPSKKYPYIRACAAPWDLLKNSTSSKTTGISLNSLNELTKQGYGYKKALEYFLADVEFVG